MFTHDIIKINYINEGYLPNYPYHMITDKEMFEAFIGDNGFFYDNYYLIDESLQGEYDAIVASIKTYITRYLNEETPVPDWIYSYMLGAVIGPESIEADIDYLDRMLGIETEGTLAQFSLDTAEGCLEVSKEWLKKLPAGIGDERPPSIFGEMHVIKSLRLQTVSVL